MQKRKLTSQECLIALSVLYVVVAVMMNILAMKPLSFGSPVIICDGGLLISWGVFMISNIIVEVWGGEAKPTDNILHGYGAAEQRQESRCVGRAKPR